MIYFDNAATGGFKPHSVTDTVNTVIRYLSANPGRSGHRLSLTGAEIVFSARNVLAEMFGGSGERVAFTKNCTEALNLAIFGTLRKNGHVITTVYEHNSVLRPLHALCAEGLITLDVVAPTDEQDITEVISQKIRPETYLIVTTALSNVTGEALPIDKIGALARKNGILYLVDGAQGGGHIPLDLKKQGISMLALAGHKGLHGIMGSGVLIFDEQTEVEPIIYGGTGTESFNLLQPSSYPERLEAGTLNLPAIAGLKEGVKYTRKNMTAFNDYLYTSTEKLIGMLKEIPEVKCFSTPNKGGIVSFSVKNADSAEIADLLCKKYDIAVRGGLHCSPLIHKRLGSSEGGLVRASLAVQNSAGEINYFVKSLKELISGI